MPAILNLDHTSRPPRLQVIDIVRILALETAIQPGSVALLEKSRIVAQSELPNGIRTTQSLMPAIQGLLEQQGWMAADLQLVAVSQGPGSFTGLRVGVTVAKTLAYALGAEVIGIDTLSVIAKQSQATETPSSTQSLWSVMDAQRQQLFCARYRFDPAAGWQSVQPPHILDVEVWLEKIEAGDIVSGPPVKKLSARIHPAAIQAALVQLAPRATTVGQMAAEAYQQGQRHDLWGLVPMYHRLSAAEEKHAAKLRR